MRFARPRAYITLRPGRPAQPPFTAQADACSLRPDAMTLDNGLVNLAAIVSTIIVLIGTIPAILLLTTPSGGKK